jgi:hypothetical protein
VSDQEYWDLYGKILSSSQSFKIVKSLKPEPLFHLIISAPLGLDSNPLSHHDQKLILLRCRLSTIGRRVCSSIRDGNVMWNLYRDIPEPRLRRTILLMTRLSCRVTPRSSSAASTVSKSKVHEPRMQPASVLFDLQRKLC